MIWFITFVLTCMSLAWAQKEAVLWSRKGAEAYPWNEHSIFVAERIILIVLVFAVPFVNLIDTAFAFVFWIFSYPFFHDTYYYYCRSLIDENSPKFDITYTSKTSTARFTLSFEARVTWLAVATILLVLYVHHADKVKQIVMKAYEWIF